jgi:hypothetical protein
MAPLNLITAIQESTKLSAVSKKNYIEKIKHVCLRADTTLAKVVIAPSTYIPKFKTWFGSQSTSLKAYFVAVLAVFRYNPDYATKHQSSHEAWRAAFADAEADVNTRYDSNLPSTRQSAGYVSWADFTTKRDSLPHGSFERLLLSVYSYIRPLRADFGRIAVYTDDSKIKAMEPNHLIISSNGAKLVVSEYKTAKHYNEIVIEPVPGDLVSEIQKSLEKCPRTWLFCASCKLDTPFKSNRTFSKWARTSFSRLFDRPLTLQLIRHSYINSLDFNKLSISEKREIAASMGHDIATQDKYRLLFH